MPQEITHYRLDRGNITKAQITDEGFLKAHAIVTRAGVFEYRNPDGSIRRELRHPDDVFNPTSLKSMQMRPITNGHPAQKIVNADNAKTLVVGYTGETVNVDNPYISTTLLVTDKDAIKDINARKKYELSLGYNVDVVEENGQYQGEPYTHRQTNIRYNHLAIVDKARAGPEARIHLDANDAIEQESDKNAYESIVNKKEITMTDEKSTSNLTNVNIDGLSYKSAPEVANALRKETERADGLNQTLTNTNKELEKIKAERDDLMQKLEDSKNVNLDEKISVAVKQRIELIDSVKSIMGKKSAELKLDSMTDKEIKTRIVKEKCPTVNVDTASETYIDARFDILREQAIDNEGKESESLKRQRQQVVTKHDSQGAPGTKVEQARQRMLDRLKNGGCEQKKAAE